MNTTNTAINRAMATELKAERAAAGLTLDALSARSGVAMSTLKRVLNGTIDVNVADLAMICRVLGDSQGIVLTMETMVKRAVERAGGYEAVYAELEVKPMSEAPHNVTPIRKHPRDMPVEELEAEPHAATFDRELGEDEHYD